jgi:hypothetical protein
MTDQKKSSESVDYHGGYSPELVHPKKEEEPWYGKPSLRRQIINSAVAFPMDVISGTIIYFPAFATIVRGRYTDEMKPGYLEVLVRWGSLNIGALADVGAIIYGLANKKYDLIGIVGLLAVASNLTQFFQCIDSREN